MENIVRDSFIFYRGFAEAIKEMDAAETKEFVTAICDYALDGKEPDLSGLMAALFLTVKPQIDRGIHILEGQNGRRCSEYVNWRKAVFERDDYTCQRCWLRGVELNAHHIKPYAKYPEFRYVVENGITLCKECHKEVHRNER